MKVFQHILIHVDVHLWCGRLHPFIVMASLEVQGTTSLTRTMSDHTRDGLIDLLGGIAGKGQESTCI